MKAIKVFIIGLMLIFLGTSCASAQNVENIKNVISKLQLPTGKVTSIETHGNNIWVGTEDKGLIRVSKNDPKSIKEFTTVDKLTFKKVFAIYKNKQGEMWVITDKGILKNDLSNEKLSLIDSRIFKNPQIKQSPDGSLWISENKEIVHLGNLGEIKAFDIDTDFWDSNFNIDSYGKLWVTKEGKAYYINSEDKLVEYVNINKYKNSFINGKKVKQYEPQPEDYSKIINVFFDADGSKWFSIEVNSMGIFGEYKLVHLMNDGQAKEYGPFGQDVKAFIPIDKDRKIIYAYFRVMVMSSWMVYGELDTKANKLSILVNDANGDASEGNHDISELYSDDKGNSYYRKRELSDDHLLYYIKPKTGLIRYFVEDDAFGEAKYVDSQDNAYLVKDKALYIVAPINTKTVLGKAQKSTVDAFIDGKYIQSYNVLGKLAFRLKDLSNFGFKIAYDKDKKVYSVTRAINNNSLPKTFPYSTEYFTKQKAQANKSGGLEDKEIYLADSMGTSEFDAYYQIYMLGNEPVVFAKNFIRYNYNENNSRFEVYYKSSHMQDGYWNNQPLNSLLMDKDYIYAVSPTEGFIVLNKDNPSKATRFDAYSSKSIMSDKARFVAKAANGTILVFNDKGIFTFKPDVKGYFTRVAPYLTLDSVKKVKKLYPKLDSKAIYYPDKLRSLYEKDTAKFYKEMMNNPDKIRGIYQDGKKLSLINSGAYKYYPESKKKEKLYVAGGVYTFYGEGYSITVGVSHIKIDLNKLKQKQEIELFIGEQTPRKLNWQIVSKEELKDGTILYTVQNENKKNIYLNKTLQGGLKISLK